jgi:hypothetical protein
MSDLPPQHVPQIKDMLFNPDAPRVWRPGFRLTLRQRFAAWLWAPLEARIEALEKTALDQDGEIQRIKRFCEQLSSDMAKQVELRAVINNTEQSPRRRIVNGSTFVAAAELSQRKARI